MLKKSVAPLQLVFNQPLASRFSSQVADPSSSQRAISVRPSISAFGRATVFVSSQCYILFCEACRANREGTVFSVFCARTTSPEIFRGESIVDDDSSNERPAAEHVRARARVPLTRAFQDRVNIWCDFQQQRHISYADCFIGPKQNIATLPVNI